MSYTVPDSRGFTLVELLVGLSLLALIAILLFGGFRFGLRAWEAGDRWMAALNDIEQVHGLLRRRLSAAEPPVIIAAAGDIRTIATFSGTRSELTFVAPLPAHRGTGGLYAFSLKTEPAADGDRLILAWRLFRPDMIGATTPEPQDPSVLLESVRSVNFDYFGRLHPGAPPHWVDRWDDSEQLPDLIRIRVDLGRDSGMTWPDLVVAPRLRRPGG